MQTFTPYDEDVQRSHRSALMRKDPEHYRPAFGDVPDEIPYVWPVRSPAVIERELRKEDNARRRQQRTAEKLAAELVRTKNRRTQAAKRGWKTRAAKRRAEELRRGATEEQC